MDHTHSELLNLKSTSLLFTCSVLALHLASMLWKYTALSMTRHTLKHNNWKQSHAQFQHICQFCAINISAINPVSEGGGYWVTQQRILAQWDSCSRCDMIGQERSLQGRFSVTVRGTKTNKYPKIHWETREVQFRSDQWGFALCGATTRRKHGQPVSFWWITITIVCFYLILITKRKWGQHIWNLAYSVMCKVCFFVICKYL